MATGPPMFAQTNIWASYSLDGDLKKVSDYGELLAYILVYRDNRVCADQLKDLVSDSSPSCRYHSLVSVVLVFELVNALHAYTLLLKRLRPEYPHIPHLFIRLPYLLILPNLPVVRE